MNKDHEPCPFSKAPPEIIILETLKNGWYYRKCCWRWACAHV